MEYTLYDSKLVEAFKNGAVGVLPTDTIYVLAGSALVPKTVERIYDIRRRDRNKALIILISSLKDLKLFHIKIDKVTEKILQKVWPGRVSVILPCLSSEFIYLHRGLYTLAFRLPNHKELVNLVKSAGPIVVPSANPQGFPPAKTISEARKYFGDKVDFYVNLKKLESEPSTLISIENGIIAIKREGADMDKVQKVMGYKAYKSKH